MNSFKTLLAMQLKEKLDLSFLKNKKQTIFKVIFSLLAFASVAGGTYLILFLFRYLGIFSILGWIPISAIAFVFTIYFVISLFSCTIGLSKTLFYSKDNQLLMTFPAKTNDVYISKIVVYYLGELKRTFLFIIPILFAYGLICKVSVVFYFWMPVMMCFFTFIPVLLGSLLAIPANYIIAFFKKYPLIKVATLFVALVGVVIGVIFLIRLIPSDIDLISSWAAVSKGIRAVLEWTTKYLFPFYAVCIFLCGKVTSVNSVFFTEYSWIVFLSMIGLIAVLMVLNYYLCRPFYFKLVSRQFEFKTDTVKKSRKNRKIGSIWSTSIYEGKKLVRDASVLSNTILLLIVAPITLLLINKIYGAINTRLLGNHITVAFNILIILLFILSHNINVSSIYSRDGEAFRIAKTFPNKAFIALSSRLLYNFVSTTLILVLTALPFFIYSKLSAGNCVLVFFMMLFVSYSHILWSADIDFANPQIELFRNEGASARNPNETKSTVLTFLLSLLFAFVTLFLLLDGLRFVWLKLFFLGFVLLMVRILIFSKKAKSLYREA